MCKEVPLGSYLLECIVMSMGRLDRRMLRWSEGGLIADRVNRYLFPVAILTFVFDNAVNFGEEGVIPS